MAVLGKTSTAASTKVPDWDGTTIGWLKFSPRFLHLMSSAGCDLVCRPQCLENSQALGWTPAEIVEGRMFVWEQMYIGMAKCEAARNALNLAGPEHDGETYWHKPSILPARHPLNMRDVGCMVTASRLIFEGNFACLPRFPERHHRTSSTASICYRGWENHHRSHKC